MSKYRKLAEELIAADVPLTREAAAALLELEAYNDEHQSLHSLLQIRVEKLEAERDGLREALETIAEERDAGRHDGLPEPCPALDAETMFAVARAALEGK
jgi:hypothetical protein